MKKLQDTKTLVAAALLAALTCLSTMVIQIPTPALGYIHPGDSLVLLCGVILGPVLGGLSAGLGSMLADVFSGYLIYAIPTFVIKALCAAIAGMVFQAFRQHFAGKNCLAFLLAGIPAELNMVCGYFLNKFVQTLFLAGSLDSETLSAGLANAVAGLIPDSIQGISGILIGLALFPVLAQIPEVKVWLNRKKQTESHCSLRSH